MPTLLAYATAADAANAQVLGLNMDTWIILTLILLAISSFLFVSHWFNIARHGK
ncbi:MAG: cytochrome B6 [Prochlorococcus sp.]